MVYKAEFLYRCNDGICTQYFIWNASYKKYQKIAQKPMDVHLMIVEPDRYKDFKKCGADILTIHLEACNHLHRTIHAIKEEGMKAGVAINPHTPINLLKVINDLDMVCIMSVNPGFDDKDLLKILKK